MMNPKRITPTMYPSISRSTLTDVATIGFNPGHGVKVAVLDTGANDDVDVARYDLTGTHEFDGMQFPKAHGTTVSAIIKHFARDAEVVSIKVSPDGNVRFDTFAQGLLLALQEGAQIVNASLGFPHQQLCAGNCSVCQFVKDIIQNTGIIFVNAVGNEGPNDETVRAPAMAENVVSVGMVTSNGMAVDYISSRGLVGIKKPNLLTSGYVERFSVQDWGTSFAAPVITGVLAAAYPAYHGDTERLTNALYRSCSRFGKVPDHHQGHGVFNIRKFAEVIASETVIAKS